jgi:hypothetical protein
LEDIFRLIDYLDDVSGRDDLRFSDAGGFPRFDYTALWELKLKIKRLQGQVVETYLMTFDDISEDEVHDLEQWVARGYSIYSNPYLISDESGNPMDFINGCRVGLDMDENPSEYFGEAPTECASDDWDDDEMPF